MVNLILELKIFNVLVKSAKNHNNVFKKKQNEFKK